MLEIYKRNNYICAVADGESVYEDDHGLRGNEIPRSEFTILNLDCNDKIHSQAVLDRWYGNVLPIKSLIPNFKLWLTEHLSQDDAETIISNIYWH